MDKSVKDFLEDLLNAEEVPKPWEPDIGDIEKLSPENFRLVSSIIQICKSITDEQISNYVEYLNKALKNSGQFEKFEQVMREVKTTEFSDEEFI